MNEEMLLFDLLRLKYPSIKEESCKIHLAVWNGTVDPVDEFLAGDFESWQALQTKKNFKLEYIVSLLQLQPPRANRWLFAGVFASQGSQYVEKKKRHQYKTSELTGFKSLTGKLVLRYKRMSRQSYPYAEKCAGSIFVCELKQQKMVIEEFPGYKKIMLSRKKLEILFSQCVESWRGALSSVSGIYLITDTKTGKLYVGSATGEGGIWQRWSEYSENGHGGNKELRALLSTQGKEYSKHFQYSILEIADTHANSDDVLARESYWKNVLCSREYGYNAN